VLLASQAINRAQAASTVRRRRVGTLEDFRRDEAGQGEHVAHVFVEPGTKWREHVRVDIQIHFIGDHVVARLKMKAAATPSEIITV